MTTIETTTTTVEPLSDDFDIDDAQLAAFSWPPGAESEMAERVMFWPVGSFTLVT